MTRPPRGCFLANGLAGDQRREMPCHGLARDRFKEIFHHPHAAGDVAIEIDLVTVADDQHAHAGLHHVRQFAQRVQRLLLSGDIDNQHLGRLQLGHRGNGGAHRAAPNIHAASGDFAQAVAQHLFGCRVAQKGKDGQTVRPADDPTSIREPANCSLGAHASSFPVMPIPAAINRPRS